MFYNDDVNMNELKIYFDGLRLSIETFKLIYIASEMHKINKISDEDYYNILAKARQLIDDEITRTAK